LIPWQADQWFAVLEINSLEGGSMMGLQVAPARLFYDFCLDDHVPGDHPPRRIDLFLDLTSVRRELAGHCGHIGHPSIGPESMMRMLSSATRSGLLRLCHHLFGRHRPCDHRRCRSQSRLRGPTGAKDEFLLAATAQNFRKRAKLRPERPLMAPPIAAQRKSRPARTNTSLNRPKRGGCKPRDSRRIEPRSIIQRLNQQNPPGAEVRP
jgi:hypothetical protein